MTKISQKSQLLISWRRIPYKASGIVFWETYEVITSLILQDLLVPLAGFNMESRVTLLSIFQPRSGALHDEIVWNLEEISQKSVPTMKISSSTTLLTIRATLQLVGLGWAFKEKQTTNFTGQTAPNQRVIAIGPQVNWTIR